MEIFIVILIGERYPLNIHCMIPSDNGKKLVCVIVIATKRLHRFKQNFAHIFRHKLSVKLVDEQNRLDRFNIWIYLNEILYRPTVHVFQREILAEFVVVEIALTAFQL